MISWKSISDIGAGDSSVELLFWTPDGAELGFWQDCEPNAGNWVNADDEIIHPTHYARIEKPE